MRHELVSLRTVQCRMQALAAICRHVAVDVVTAAERDSQEGPGSVSIQPEPIVAEEQPAGEEAHQQTICWDSSPSASASSLLTSAWQGTGGGCGPFRCGGRQRFQQSRASSPAALEAAADALSIPSQEADDAQQSMVRQMSISCGLIGTGLKGLLFESRIEARSAVCRGVIHTAACVCQH